MHHDVRHKVELKPLITLRPKYGMRMKLERRRQSLGQDQLNIFTYVYSTKTCCNIDCRFYMITFQHVFHVVRSNNAIRSQPQGLMQIE
jgi:hypothetical protein